MNGHILLLVAIKSASTDEAIRALEVLMGQHGLPLALQTDKGKEFVSDKFNAFLASKGIELLESAPEHHQSLGGVETRNNTLGTSLRIWANTGQDTD